jgi:hypothetical protein
LGIAGDSKKAGHGRAPVRVGKRTGALILGQPRKAVPCARQHIAANESNTTANAAVEGPHASLTYALAEDGLVRIVPRSGTFVRS